MNARRTPIQPRPIHINISCSSFVAAIVVFVVVVYPMEAFNDENREIFIRYSAEDEDEEEEKRIE